ncbi:MAG TPA: hypothetical protein PLO23_02605 [Alphaproteobacteria bacterium]|nr:hypothetical protein [Alphaproteobacteria bacterium]
MLGELFNSVMDELADDPETRRVLGLPFRALSTIFDIKAGATVATTSAAIMDGPSI